MGGKLKLGVLVAFFVLMLSACTYAGTYRLTVNKGTNCVTVYEKQGNNYVPIKAMICSVGANDGTPSGVLFRHTAPPVPLPVPSCRNRSDRC